MRLRITSLLVLTGLTLGASACRAGDPSRDPAAALPAGVSTRAAELYRARCASCHGEDGRGGGPAARPLAVPPRDLSELGWHERATDERIARVIVGGGVVLGLSPLMPKNPDLRDEDALVAELVLLVRSFRR